jgi:hypothetical protein
MAGLNSKNRLTMLKNRLWEYMWFREQKKSTHP